MYRNTKATLQKLLGVGTRTTSRELCVQFGCARHEPSVKAALVAYKERFVRRLPAAQQGHVDFSRPVFLATAFYLVARKNRVQVGSAGAGGLGGAKERAWFPSKLWGRWQAACSSLRLCMRAPRAESLCLNWAAQGGVHACLLTLPPLLAGGQEQAAAAAGGDD